METRMDFVQWLEVDMVLMILSFLDDPSDLIRACAVSRFWKHFMISNEISKKLCLRLFPQMARLADSQCTTRKCADLGSSNVAEWETMEKEFKCYALLARTFTASATDQCLAEAMSASSTDHFPLESVKNTLYSRDKFRFKYFYWSSKGSKNPEEPETLIYKLCSDLCVINEINIKPFQAYFQTHSPIYSAKAVRFRMGHPRLPSDVEYDLGELPLEVPIDEKFIWTYTSPVFPMNQDSSLQKFKLPEPVLCIGGYIQIELLGRVQKQEVDDLYYICISHVKASGESLFPVFDIEIVDPSGKFLLKYFPEKENQPLPEFCYGMIDETMDDIPEFDPFGSDDEDDDDGYGYGDDNDNDPDFFM